MEEILDIGEFAKRAAMPQPQEKPKETPPPFSSTKAPTFPRIIDMHTTYIDPETGDAVTVTVQSKVPVFSARVQIARIEAQLCGQGVSFVSLPPEKAAWIRALARMQVQLINPPQGLIRYMSENMAALFQMNELLELHEVAFFRPGAATGGATQSVTDLVVTSPLDQWLGAQAGQPGGG